MEDTDNNNNAYRLIADSMSDLVCLHRPDGTYRWVSPSSQRILGYAPEDLIGVNPYTLFHPDDAERIRTSAHDPALRGSDNIRVRYRMKHADGHYIWFESLTQSITDDSGTVVTLHTTSRDVTHQVELEQALIESEALYKTVVHTMTEGVLVFDHRGVIITYNSQAVTILGTTPGSLTGLSSQGASWQSFHLDGQPFPADEIPLAITLATGQPCRDVVMGILHDNIDRVRWISVNSEPVSSHGDSQPDQPAVVITVSDIQERQEHEEALRRLATHDPLTTLPNRLLLQDRFEMAIKSALRSRTGFACLYLDLDNFKPINDQYGHGLGDQALVELADRLRKGLREEDTVARIGGDEFVVILGDVHRKSQTARVTDKLLQALEAPIDLGTGSASVTASVGVSLYPDHGRSGRELLNAADTAMYHAKNQGGGHWVVYRPEWKGGA